MSLDLSTSSVSSTLEAQKVESLLSVEDNANMKCAETTPHPSLEDISADLVKDTLVKVMSGMVDSPSTTNINPTSNETGKMIESPSTTNLDEFVNQCFKNLKNNTNKSATERNHMSRTLSDHSDKFHEEVTYEEQKNNITLTDPLDALGSNLNKVAETDNNIAHVTVGNCEETNKDLYSSSSTHLCSKLSEVLQINHSHTHTNSHQTDGTNSVSVIEGMSEPLEQAVEETLESNFKKLEQNFDSNQDIATDYAVQQGRSILDAAIKSSANGGSVLSQSVDAGRSRDELTISKLKLERDTYRTELEKIRPDYNEIALRCNALDIDPAIATVPYLLDMLKTAHDQCANLRDEVSELTQKLYNTSALLDENKRMYQHLKAKLRDIEEEDTKRREKNFLDMHNYYKNKLDEIQTELQDNGIHIGADFWTPKMEDMTQFLTQLTQHKEQVAEEELQRELSNAGTDKFSDNELEFTIPVEGFRESICETEQIKNRADAEAKIQEATKKESGAELGRDSGTKGDKSKTCGIM